MAKWDFKIVGASFVKELVPIADDVQPRSQSFMQPSFHLEGGKIVMKESGQYVTAIYFPQIGEIDGVAPTDLEDAYDKLLTLVENFNGGGVTPQTLAETLAEDNKTNDIPIVSNNGKSSVYIANDFVDVRSQSGGDKRLTLEEDYYSFLSNTRFQFDGAGINMNTSTDGFGLPRLTTTQMNAIAFPTDGMLVRNTTESKIYQFNGTVWEPLSNPPQTLAETLAEDNKTNDIPIVSNNGKALVGVNDDYTLLSYDTQSFAMTDTVVQLYSEVPVVFDSTVSTDFNTPVLNYNNEEIATQPWVTSQGYGTIDITNDFADDVAAAIGGIQVGKLYHTAGIVKVRLV